MKPTHLLVLLLLGQLLPAQPQPGDQFREFIWLPLMVQDAGKFLRVGGKLDYQISADHFPQHLHQNGNLSWPDSVPLQGAIRAELVLERVQSHEDTRGLAVRFNDQAWLPVPDLPGIPEPQSDYMFHAYPVMDIPLTHLQAGRSNSFALKVDSTQVWNWPQNIFYGLILRVYYDHPAPKLQLAGIRSGQALAAQQALWLEGKQVQSAVKVEYIGEYADFNWEGDGQYDRWHGHFHRGEFRNHIGTVTQAPFRLLWDTEWVPDQSHPLRIAARVEDASGLISMTEVVSPAGFERSYRVSLAQPYDQPANWVTREDSFVSRFCLEVPPAEVTACQLAWRSWSPCYARGVYVNGQQIFTQEDPCYEYAEHLLELQSLNALLAGENVLSTGKTPLIDGQMVHGMEVQWPGIMVKVKSNPTPSVHISSGQYLQRPHFIITTPAATYYYDRAGGGLSRLLDRDGKDWINFQMEPWGEYPAAAASAFRGLPNFVFGSAAGGAGHPGHEQCISEQADSNRIVTRSVNGKWQWQWTFFADHAEVEMQQVDPDHAYWFLYEGTPGGTFSPSQQYLGTNLAGPLGDQWDYYRGEKNFDQWQWAYFGQEETPRVLYLLQEQADTLSDTFSYLGNTEAGINSPDGMAVFGFGRKEGAIPLMTQPNTFQIGFYESAIRRKQDHKRFARWLRKQFP